MELVVQAGANDVVGKLHVAGLVEAGAPADPWRLQLGKEAGAEIDVRCQLTGQPFPEHVHPQRRRLRSSQSRSQIVAAGHRQRAADVDADLRERRAAGAVGEPAVPGDAETGAQGVEPSCVGLGRIGRRAERRNEVSGAFCADPGNIFFDAADPIVDLVVAPQRTADLKTGDIKVVGQVAPEVRCRTSPSCVCLLVPQMPPPWTPIWQPLQLYLSGAGGALRMGAFLRMGHAGRDNSG